MLWRLDDHILALLICTVVCHTVLIAFEKSAEDSDSLFVFPSREKVVMNLPEIATIVLLVPALQIL